MQQFNLNRTWSKAKPKFNVSPPLKVPKAKAVPVLPEKLVGPAPDAAFAPKSPLPIVPGQEGIEYRYQQFKIPAPRQILPGRLTFLVLIQVEGELEREARVRSDALITEILNIAFKDEEFPKTDKLKLLKKPLKMEDGAVFVWERVQQIAHLELEYQTWDDRLLRFGIEVSSQATLTPLTNHLG
jgi:hypothetical protein